MFNDGGSYNVSITGSAPWSGVTGKPTLMTVGVNQAGMFTLAGNSGTADFNGTGIQIREHAFAGAMTGAWNEAPKIGFHWAGRVAAQIGMSADGSIRIINNPGNAYETLRAGTIYSNDVQVVTQNGGTWAINITGNAGYAASAGSATSATNATNAAAATTSNQWYGLREMSFVYGDGVNAIPVSGVLPIYTFVNHGGQVHNIGCKSNGGVAASRSHAATTARLSGICGAETAAGPGSPPRRRTRSSRQERNSASR